MPRIARKVALIAALLATAAASAGLDLAGAEQRTSTLGRVCESDGYGKPVCGARSVKNLRTFFSYFFTGRTKGASSGSVHFSYRKRGSKGFVSFNGRNGRVPRAFFSQRERPVARVGKHGNWQIDFSPNFPGSFTLRARFGGAGGAAPSEARRNVEVAGNE